MPVKSKSRLVKGCLAKSCAPPPVGTGGSLSFKQKAAYMGKVAKKIGVGKSSTKKSAVSQPSTSSKSSSSVVTEPEKQKAFRKLLGGAAATVLAKMNPKVVGTLKKYMVDGFRAINGVLRNPKWNPGDSLLQYAGVASRDELISAIKAMRSALENGPSLKEDTTLHRVIDFPMKLKVGAVLTDKGFVSTSLYKDTADRIVRDISEGESSQFTMLRIAAKKGTKFLPGMESEQELILAPDSRFRVTGKTVEERLGVKYTVYDVELL